MEKGYTLRVYTDLLEFGPVKNKEFNRSRKERIAMDNNTPIVGSKPVLVPLNINYARDKGSAPLKQNMNKEFNGSRKWY